MFQNYHRMEAEILSSYQNHEVTQCQSIKYINLPSVYEQVENAKKKKTFGKAHISIISHFLLNGTDSQEGMME